MSIRETCGKQNDKNRICKNAHIQIAEYVHFIYLAQLNAWTSVIFYKKQSKTRWAVSFLRQNCAERTSDYLQPGALPTSARKRKTAARVSADIGHFAELYAQNSS